MTFVEAARRVLGQAGEPLHFREITRRAIDEGLIEVQGSTPWNSMNGTLRRTIRRDGDAAEVVSLGDGMFGLKIWGLDEEDLSGSDGFPSDIVFSDLDYKWRSARSKGVRLFVTPCEQPAKRGIQRSLGLAFMWGISNLFGAVSLLLGKDSAVARGLGMQLLRSGVANTVLAWVGSDLLAAEYEGQQADGESTKPSASLMPDASVVNLVLALGGVHLLRGMRLTRRSDAQSRKRGKGLGLLLQGGFYLALGLVSYVLGQQQKTAD